MGWREGTKGKTEERKIGKKIQEAEDLQRQISD